MVDCRDPDAGRQRRSPAARLHRLIVADLIVTGLMFWKPYPLPPMKPKPLLPTFAAALVLSTATGCFNYVPTEIGAVPPGESVRLFLTRAGVDAINEAGNEEALDTFFEPVLSGEFVRRTDADLYVRVPTVRRQVGFHSAQLGQDIRVPAGEVVQIERQELSRGKTGLLVGGTAAAITGLIVFILNEARQPEAVNPPFDPVEDRRPGVIIFRFGG